MGPRSLGTKLDISMESAADLYVAFKKKYAGIEEFCQGVVAECKRVGYVRTMCGRRRYIDNINASDNKTKGNELYGRSKKRQKKLILISYYFYLVCLETKSANKQK